MSYTTWYAILSPSLLPRYRLSLSVSILYTQCSQWSACGPVLVTTSFHFDNRGPHNLLSLDEFTEQVLNVVKARGQAQRDRNMWWFINYHPMTPHATAVTGSFLPRDFIHRHNVVRSPRYAVPGCDWITNLSSPTPVKKKMKEAKNEATYYPARLAMGTEVIVIAT